MTPERPYVEAAIFHPDFFGPGRAQQNPPFLSPGFTGLAAQEESLIETYRRTLRQPSGAPPAAPPPAEDER
jgi:hypothetical protein